MNNASKGRCVTITPSGIAPKVSGAVEAMSNPERRGWTTSAEWS